MGNYFSRVLGKEYQEYFLMFTFQPTIPFLGIALQRMIDPSLCKDLGNAVLSPSRGWKPPGAASYEVYGQPCILVSFLCLFYSLLCWKLFSDESEKMCGGFSIVRCSLAVKSHLKVGH